MKKLQVIFNNIVMMFKMIEVTYIIYNS
jgi:hypothetical protein